MTLKPTLCPECETVSEFRVEQRLENYWFHGQSVLILANVAVCEKCHKAVDSDLDDDNLERARARFYAS